MISALILKKELDYQRTIGQDISPALTRYAYWKKVNGVRASRERIGDYYRKPEHDALLKMFYGEGGWKVGLDESFASRQ